MREKPLITDDTPRPLRRLTPAGEAEWLRIGERQGVELG
jgi:hypothetical protein